MGTQGELQDDTNLSSDSACGPRAKEKTLIPNIWIESHVQSVCGLL